MKKTYKAPSIKIDMLEVVDVIATSDASVGATMSTSKGIKSGGWTFDD